MSPAGSASRPPNPNDVAYLGFLLSSRGQALLISAGLAPPPANIDHVAIAQLSKITS